MFYVNNLAYGQEHAWLTNTLAPLATNADSVVVSTDVIHSLDQSVNDRWALEKISRGENKFTARHSSAEQDRGEEKGLFHESTTISECSNMRAAK